MRCVNAFFIDITNIFVSMSDFSCHFNQKDTLRIPNECLCVILTYYFLLCGIEFKHLLFQLEQALRNSGFFTCYPVNASENGNFNRGCESVRVECLKLDWSNKEK